MSQLRVGVPKELDRYLIPTEKIIFMIHMHWFRILKEGLAAAGALVLFVLLDQVLPARVPFVRDILFLGVLVVVGWFVWTVIDWRLEYFLATDRRLMLVHGVIVRRVAIMPMSKVTDMEYKRSPIGHLFGFGRYELESAGQDQALRTVPYVPRPDYYYKTLSAVIFAPAARRAYDKLLPTSTGTALPISEPEEAWWKRK